MLGVICCFYLTIIVFSPHLKLHYITLRCIAMEIELAENATDSVNIKI